MNSAQQAQWIELSEAIHVQLRKYAELMPAMKPDEIKVFVEAVREAKWLEETARTFDQDVELRERRLTYDG